ncbi:MAG TPA: hypothetical protein VEE84_02710, partial [Burkholderiaceae bacterium]|nr:hypothetical protein [Burkholderiaceae bacterium]
LKSLDPPAGCTVLRRDFDSFLLEKARACGARFFAQTRFLGAASMRGYVEVLTNRGAFHCNLLLGADGVASAVRGKVFGRDLVRYVPALEALVPISQAQGAHFDRRVLFDFGAVARGYGWIFPKHGHLNVGVYSPFGGRRLREQLAAFIARYTPPRASPKVDYRGFPIPVRNVQGRFQDNRVWLLGDAAGFADGLFGEGIYFALKSAALAARALRETGFAPCNTRYTELVKEELLPDLRAAEWMGKALFALPAFAFSRLACNPKISDRFAGLISGTVGYRECLRKTLTSSPQWLFSRAKTLPRSAIFPLATR